MREPGYTRMFPSLPARDPGGPGPAELGALGGPMDGAFRHTSNIGLPAGYTYLAQFVAHDLTSGPTFRLRLRCIFGDGPAGSPELYDRRRPGFLREGRHLKAGALPDVPRRENGRAILGDARNDRTLLISQLHAVFIRWHNAVLEALGGTASTVAFRQAQRLVRGHYQWLVVHDLLPRLVPHPPTTQQVFGGPTFFTADAVGVEFALAGGQIGHTMVQPRYRLNSQAPGIVDYPAFHPRVFEDQGDAVPLKDLRGQPLDHRAVIDWDNFFPIGNPIKVQASSRLNATICRPMFRFPIPDTADGLERSIPYRTLRAGELASLPSGQSLADAMGFHPLSPEEVWGNLPYTGPAPLWFYLLREAELQQSGAFLGDVGAAIFTDAVIAALAGDWESYQDSPARDECGPLSRARTVGQLVAAITATASDPSAESRHGGGHERHSRVCEASRSATETTFVPYWLY